MQSHKPSLIPDNIDQFMCYIQSSDAITKEERALLRDFSAVYFSTDSHGFLSNHSHETLISILRAHLDLLSHPKDNCFVASSLSLNQDTTNSVFIQTAAKDIPFLVDSITMAMSRMEMPIRYMLHSSGIHVIRNDMGKVTGIEPYSTASKRSDFQPEAILVMELSVGYSQEIIDNALAQLKCVLNDVKRAVSDWKPMKEQLSLSAQTLKEQEPSVTTREVLAFMEWVNKDHFVFFGYRYYALSNNNGSVLLTPDMATSLGVLKQEGQSFTKNYDELPDSARKLALNSEEILVISKTNTLSTIHRSDWTDVIRIKHIDLNNNIIGEFRFIGLFTSAAYTKPATEIPLLRKKAETILQRSSFPPRGHRWKNLIYTLNNMPRNDFMHADVDTLYEWGIGIMGVVDTQQIKTFSFLEPRNRYISFLVYFPQRNASENLRKRLVAYFQEACQAESVSYDVHLFGTSSIRIHVEVRVDPDKILSLFDKEKINADVAEICASWSGRLQLALRERFGRVEGDNLFSLYNDAFSAGYIDDHDPVSCVDDIKSCQPILQLGDDLTVREIYENSTSTQALSLRLFRRNEPLPLSDVLPIFDNMGVRVISEDSYYIKTNNSDNISINHFNVELSEDLTKGIGDVELFKSALYRSWSGCVTNDTLNKLVIKAGLSWEKIRILRAYSAYFQQIKFQISSSYVAKILLDRSKLAALFIDLFYARFDPSVSGDRDVLQAEIQEKIEREMASIQSLDEDRVCRQYVDTIKATVRTNFFRSTGSDSASPLISLKIRSKQVPGMVLPAPEVEAFVYSSSFEGVHLRTSCVARGGLRWSSRRDDYRTEILGLVRAQQVKNSVIVPSGAKGGFILKRDMTNFSRDEVTAEARRCYALFMHGLLDLVDNRQGTEVVSYEDVFAYDNEDPYMVVAADKGTATFSDLANSVSEERHFWLDDAFASGGSYGYDHKKMGITAKGAWVSAIRHFKELGVDLQTEKVSLIGIGDMSGDVFGNGLLLSSHLQLKGAFNHLHIFLDPNPDPSISFEERKRLFELPGSTWMDYQSDLISKGGGVFDRNVKSIELTPEIQAMLGVTQASMVPAELIRHMLCAPVDMIWNGGIGTYVKSIDEDDSDVGDPANTQVRVNGQDLQARVFCEGGNLGLTQRGRIEFEKHSDGKICTDFIDNSAGVNCSDVEVNIKMLLRSCMDSGFIDREERNKLLESMTDEVSDIVLYNNKRQTDILYFMHHYASESSLTYADLLDYLVSDYHLIPAQEDLPDAAALRAMAKEGASLSMPEICTLFSHTKLHIRSQLSDSDFISDPDMRPYLYSLFPSTMLERFKSEIDSHPLANEIINTVIVNELTADMGFLFVFLILKEFDVTVENVVKAYVTVVRIFNIGDIFSKIDNIGVDVTPDARHSMRSYLMLLVRRAVRWILRQYTNDISISNLVSTYHMDKSSLPEIMSLVGNDSIPTHKDGFVQGWVDGGVDRDFAESVYTVGAFYDTFNISFESKEASVDSVRYGSVYVALISYCSLDLFRQKVGEMTGQTEWSSLLSYSFKRDMDRLQRKLALSVLTCTESGSVKEKLDYWSKQNAPLLQRWNEIIQDISGQQPVDSSIITIGIRVLKEIAMDADT